ncbi:MULTISPECIES: anaerobic C4-dicarboxylate transporter family protein [Microbacterium]|uniref:anaerobic C4-dicarboxylate transporter family protein n=1 Tax=Microbacterium TaxID=33882 RepID=UPI00285F127E|nr:MULTISPECIES: anaerobic C4-dicarboxylate transporter family protein [Microbacterium]MDR7111782.1 anaerobic C4-dicarboxylate transporter DcuA/anaerobic C4-dicarboxylate transporter DcuB [Microbacterium trichothecenolyticum]MDT0143680.1 anaerobic C4-dicarboxylate transporter family protein [Microbacterium sp. PRC9]
METVIVILQACVVIGAIVMGVRTGGIGLGLWGVVGTAILVFVFRLEPGSPPVDAFFIIIAVITASSAMQAAGGIDYLVAIASKIIQRNPARLTFVAPLVAFVFTVLSGTSNIFFALIPVIYETAYRNGQRPERALAASTVTSGLGITASPVSAAMAAYLVLMDGTGYGLPQILAVTVPAAIVACIATSFVQQRIGKNLLDDPVFLKRVEEGTVEVPAPLKAAYAAKIGGGAGAGTSSLGAPAGGEAVKVQPVEHPVPPGGATAAWIFIAGTLLVVTLGLFPSLRPAFPNDEGELVPIGMSPVIEMVMFTVALVIILVRKVKPSLVVEQPLLRAGYVAAVALFGIAWMADTFISANEETIIEPLGAMIESNPLLLAVALFLVCGLTTSQSATTNTLIPIALAAGLAPGVITAMWPSLIGVWLFPANGSQIASVETDQTGSTKLTQVPVWHSFTIPMLVSWVAVVASGLLIQLIIPA